MRNSLFILASSSPRRRELLAQAGITPDKILSPDIDETAKKGEAPLDYVKRIAREKAAVVAEKHPDAVILAADTIVVAGRKILDKTNDEKIARKHLQALSGRRHRVITAVAIYAPKTKKITVKTTETRVMLKRLSARELEDYIASGEWEGKAGAYAIQGKAAAFIPWINGSVTNVVGLPLAETLGILAPLLAVSRSSH